MITLTPEQVKERFGPLFCHRLLVMTDEKEVTNSVMPAGPLNGIT